MKGTQGSSGSIQFPGLLSNKFQKEEEKQEQENILVFTFGLSFLGLFFLGDGLTFQALFSLSGLSSTRCLANFLLRAWAIRAAGSFAIEGRGF